MKWGILLIMICGIILVVLAIIGFISLIHFMKIGIKEDEKADAYCKSEGWDYAKIESNERLQAYYCVKRVPHPDGLGFIDIESDYFTSEDVG